MSIIIYFLFSVFLFFAAFSILFKEDSKNTSNRYLGAAVLIKSIIQISFVLVMVFRQEQFLKSILKALTPLYFIIPALIFFYFRNTLSNSKTSGRYNWLHFIPFVIVSVMGIFDLLGYSESIAFNQTNISFNEFFILQTISSKYLAAIQPLIILAYLIFIYITQLKQYVLLNFKSLESNTQLMIVIWYVLFCSQIAKLLKLSFGDYILNNVGDVLFYFINLFVVFQLYRLLLALFKTTHNIFSFRRFGKSLSGK
jgi:hypothetical protein